MAYQIDETIRVPVPAERVWAYLTDPRRVVTCLPGAELLQAVDDRTFLGRVKVRIGPVTATYRGTAEFVEVDAENRRLRMVGDGQETGGSGSARLTLASEAIELPDGGSQVHVAVEVEVVGKVVQFGRGMIEEVSRQLFRQFAACVKDTLVREAAAEAGSVIGGDVTTGTTIAAAPTPPIHALGLLWRALIEWLRRLFRRIDRT